jgi:hypothetical protein
MGARARIEPPSRVLLRRRRSLERFARIRRELDAAMERRSRLWEVGAAAGTGAGRRLAQLDEQIQALWLQLREARAEALAAPRDQLVAEARARDRVYRELDRRLARTF